MSTLPSSTIEEKSRFVEAFGDICLINYQRDGTIEFTFYSTRSDRNGRPNLVMTIYEASLSRHIRLMCLLNKSIEISNAELLVYEFIAYIFEVLELRNHDEIINLIHRLRKMDGEYNSAETHQWKIDTIPTGDWSSKYGGQVVETIVTSTVNAQALGPLSIDDYCVIIGVEFYDKTFKDICEKLPDVYSIVSRASRI